MPSGLDYLRLARMGSNQQPQQPQGLAQIGLAARPAQVAPERQTYAGESPWDEQLRRFDEYLLSLYAADRDAPASSMSAEPQTPSRMPILDPYAVQDQQDAMRGRQRTRRSF